MKDLRGHYGKYIIEKVDGSPVDSEADYFVLRIDTDKNARIALSAYAEAVKESNPKLSEDLFFKLRGYPVDATEVNSI